MLEDRLSDQGFDVTDSQPILAGLMALQNTYLRTFQSLGALGLLLGTFGLAAVQMRSVLERRGEMGLLRAAGFRRRRLSLLVLLENIMLLLAGWPPASWPRCWPSCRTCSAAEPPFPSKAWASCC